MSDNENYFTTLIPQTAFRYSKEKGLKSFKQKHPIDLTLTPLHISDHNIKKELKLKIESADDYVASILLPKQNNVLDSQKNQRLQYVMGQLGL